MYLCVCSGMFTVLCDLLFIHVLFVSVMCRVMFAVNNGRDHFLLCSSLLE